MNSSPIDTQAVLSQASHQDVVQRKLTMDNLRSRLGDTRTKDERLREACEGFESVFIQKMWEQMRKSVPKEGYLHSKDEETYQSLFDVELSKKMASAGGIGLADMMYQQLSQKVTETARTTHSKLGMLPAHTPVVSDAPAAESTKGNNDVKSVTLTEDNLYSDLEDAASAESVPGAVADDASSLYSGVSSVIASAISALQKEVGTAMFASAHATGQEEAPVVPSPADMMASHMAAASAGNPLEAGQSGMPAQDVYTMVEQRAQGTASGEAPKGDTLADTQNVAVQVAQQAAASTPQSPAAALLETEKASAKTETENKPAPKGAFPSNAVWPHSGHVFSHFGWQNDPAGSKRVWNPGIGIAAKAGDNIVPCLPGKVAYIGPREGAGSSVVLEHEGGFVSFYGNVEPHQTLSVGDKVASGTAFALVTAEQFSSLSGENISPLFFELKRGEMALNPETALKSTMTASAGTRGRR